MHKSLTIARSELILGGQKSGKSQRAESVAQQWLDLSANHSAILIATAQPWDEEMRARICRHQADRKKRVPGMQTIEVPLALAQALTAHSRPDVLLVVDCLTLWLTNWLMPMEPSPLEPAQAWQAQCDAFVSTLQAAPGPVILVSNEIGLGVIPMGREVRAFVDALGLLNQQAAAACNRVQLMAAGLPLQMK
jgi:adenosylcobinamide kinase/adenosylcobinamide-phosphate guanylyltransferase